MKLLLVTPSTVWRVKCPYKIVVQTLLAFIPRYTPAIGDAFCKECKFYNGDVNSHRSFYVKCSYENHQDKNTRE